MYRASDTVSTGQVIQYPVDTVYRGALESKTGFLGNISKYQCASVARNHQGRHCVVHLNSCAFVALAFTVLKIQLIINVCR